MTGSSSSRASSSTPTVVAVNEQTEIEIDTHRWARLAADSLIAQGVTNGEMNLLFIDESEMRQLNLDHMNKDRPTDVLSFPLDGNDTDQSVDIFIGDIVVCPAYAERQADEHRGELSHDGSLNDELALLVVHGVLHVLGWDHEEPVEAGKMSAAEQALLSAHYRS